MWAGAVSLVSPDVISSQMRRVRAAATELDQMARVIAASYLELYEASLQPTNAGNGLPPGKAGFRVSDPTGDVAASGMHARMRFQVRRAARKLRKITPVLEEAEDILVEAFAETDSEIREKLRRLRELETAIAAEGG
jgi:hypothetical protein